VDGYVVRIFAKHIKGWLLPLEDQGGLPQPISSSADERKEKISGGRLAPLSIIPIRDVQTAPARRTRGNVSAGDGGDGFVA
jgi:hypothetical protein